MLKSTINFMGTARQKSVHRLRRHSNTPQRISSFLKEGRKRALVRPAILEDQIVTDDKNIRVLENKIFLQIEIVTWGGLQPRSKALSSCRYVIGSI